MMTTRQALIGAIEALKVYNQTFTSAFVYGNEPADAIEKLNSMLAKLEPSTKEIQKREARDARYAEIAEQIATILPTNVEEAMNSTEILAAIGNPEDITVGKLVRIMAIYRFNRTMKNKRIAYYSAKEGTEEAQ